jgi:hypothetical protein
MDPLRIASSRDAVKIPAASYAELFYWRKP